MSTIPADHLQRAQPLGLVLGADPGLAHFGVGVLTMEGTYHWSHVLHADDPVPLQNQWLHPAHPLARWWTRLVGLVTKFHPSVVAFEDFTWRHERRALDQTLHRAMGNTSAGMYGLCAFLHALATVPPHPIVLAYPPAFWGQELTGIRGASKETRAEILALRLDGLPSHDPGYHAHDALGVACVALDHYHAAQRLGMPLWDYHRERQTTYTSASSA